MATKVLNDDGSVNMELVKGLRLYVVMSKDGKFFRSVGYGGGGNSWVDDINSAKFYTKIGQARSRVTFWAKNYPKYGIPYIVELRAESAVILDESERVNKTLKAMGVTASKKEIEDMKNQIRRDKEEIAARQANIAKIERKLKNTQ